VREIVTGVAIGATLALLFLPIGLLTLEPAVVAVVGLSLFSACTVATSIATALPALLSRLGTDPAYGSGPLATVVQDLLSIVIYFAIASSLIG
jgi:magnesium transporter